MKVTGAQLLARTLAACGVEYVSGIPGHTIFPFANIVKQEGLTPLLVRSEAISPFAADVYCRLSGKLMAVFAHSVPGTTNLAAGLANAYADSSAMILISGETAGILSGGARTGTLEAVRRGRPALPGISPSEAG